MLTDTSIIQDGGIAKIKALLIAARPRLIADSRSLAHDVQLPLAKAGDSIEDRSPAITRIVDQLKGLHTAVITVAVTGAAATSARDLTARALAEMDQSLGKLAASYSAVDQASSTILLAESVRLLKASKASSALASKALGIPWPLQ